MRYFAKDAHNYRGPGTTLGQPVDPDIDVGQSVADRKPVQIRNWWAWNLGDLEGIEPDEHDGDEHEVKYLEPLFLDLEEDDENPVKMPTVVHCIGANFKSYAQEAQAELSIEPTTISKSPKAIGYHPDRIIVPKDFHNDVDYEAHLAIILCRSCRNVSEQDAMKYVAGFTSATNVVNRKHPLKSFKSSCQLGPFIVNKLSIEDRSEVQIEGKLNGKLVQKGKLGEMAFSVPQIIASLSRKSRLQPGTIILTG